MHIVNAAMPCSFWYVQELAGGRLDEARLGFEKMLPYATHQGLYTEQISRTGEQPGNFPQALTHVALIAAAINLDRPMRLSRSRRQGVGRSAGNEPGAPGVRPLSAIGRDGRNGLGRRSRTRPCAD